MTSDKRLVQCEGKVPFADFRTARAAANRKRRRSVYRCRFCQAFHVGNDQPRDTVKGAKRKHPRPRVEVDTEGRLL